MPPTKPDLPPSFLSKKKRILQSLAVPTESYDDLSPKGSVDEGIRDLIDEINQLDGCVTTSSCAGRISVFLEGKKNLETNSSLKSGEEAARISQDDAVRETKAGIGGKGGGGRWLFVSHDRISMEGPSHDFTETFGMRRNPMGQDAQSYGVGSRFIHFKFEPMILHVLTASIDQAQIVLSAALQAGFRESGALNLVLSSTEPATPMVGIRSMGLALESLIGYHSNGQEFCTVSPRELKILVEISNERFGENEKRISRFRELLKQLTHEGAEKGKRKGVDGEEWEDPSVRRERKKAEGLLKRQQLKEAEQGQNSETEENSSIAFPDQIT